MCRFARGVAAAAATRGRLAGSQGDTGQEQQRGRGAGRSQRRPRELMFCHTRVYTHKSTHTDTQA